ncbi:MAG: hypothetical protein HYX41_05490 [Bdellovibrio sp.]|nr:hypothetical protein [Bdellovibrio sp.]
MAQSRKLPTFGVLVLSAALGASCSTTRLAPAPPPLPPSYSQVPHPEGTDVADLVAVLRSPDYPTDVEFPKTCDKDFNQLKDATVSEKERTDGIRELLRRDPIHYHWCFYGKLMALEKTLGEVQYVDEKQKAVLDTFDFLVPVAREFAHEYHDSRYLRWATNKYRKLSEWIFYRKLNLTPAGTAELVEIANPFGLWRDPFVGTPVLDKYHIAEPAAPAVANSTLVPKFGAEPAPIEVPSGMQSLDLTPPVASTAPATADIPVSGEIPAIDPTVSAENSASGAGASDDIPGELVAQTPSAPANNSLAAPLTPPATTPAAPVASRAPDPAVVNAAPAVPNTVAPAPSTATHSPALAAPAVPNAAASVTSAAPNLTAPVAPINSGSTNVAPRSPANSK